MPLPPRVHKCAASRRTPYATSESRPLGRVEDGRRDSPVTNRVTSVSSTSAAATRCWSSQALKIAAARTYRRTVLVAYPRVMSTSTKSSTQRPSGPDRICSQMRGRTESVSKHGLLLGPWHWGILQSVLCQAHGDANARHARGNGAPLTVTCHNATLVIPDCMTSWSYNPFFSHRRGDTPCHCRPVAAAPSTEKRSALSRAPTCRNRPKTLPSTPPFIALGLLAIPSLLYMF